MKSFLEALAAKIKYVHPSLISSQQTPHIEKRYIREAGRVTSDILDISDKLSIDGYLVTVDTEKTFNFLDREF